MEIIISIITATGVIVALIQITFLIIKNASDNKNIRRRDTIRAYNNIYRLTSELKNSFAKISGNSEFKTDIIISSTVLSNKVMDYLTQIESFAVGINLKVYTLDVFIKLTSDDLCNNLSSLVKYIEYKRIEINYNKLFDESISLINCICYIQNCKKQNIKIEHYKYIIPGRNDK